MVESDIKLALPSPFTWYEEYRYHGTDPSNSHIHPIWQMTVVLEGELSFTFRKYGCRKLHAGDVMLIAPLTLHEGHCTSPYAHSMQLFLRNFDSDAMPALTETISMLTCDKAWFGKGDVAQFEDIGKKIIQRCNAGQPLFRAWQFSLMLQLVLSGLTPLLEQINDDDDQSRLPENIAQVCVFIRQHFQEAITIQDLAQVAGLSPSRFAAVFRRYSRWTPMQFVNRMRLAYAQEQLLNGMSVMNAANISGFNSTQYFCRFFNKVMGQTPAEFRDDPYRHCPLV